MADQSSTLKVEDLEEGKRYRISFDGEWTGHAIETGKLGPAFSGGWFFDTASSIEPLPDPEPQWKHGTVVHVAGQAFAVTYNRNTGRWHYPNADPGSDWTTKNVSRAFQVGTLEILYQPGE